MISYKKRYSNLITPLLEQDISRRDLRTTIPQTSITTKSITLSISTAKRSRSRRSKGRSCLARITSRATASTLARDVLLGKSNIARAEHSGLQERRSTRDSTLDVRTTYRSYSSSISPTSTGTISRRSSTETISQLGPPIRTGCQSPELRSSTIDRGITNSYRPTNEPKEDGLASDLGGYSWRNTRVYSLRVSILTRPIYSTQQIRPIYDISTSKRSRY